MERRDIEPWIGHIEYYFCGKSPNALETITEADQLLRNTAISSISRKVRRIHYGQNKLAAHR